MKKFLFLALLLLAGCASDDANISADSPEGLYLLGYKDFKDHDYEKAAQKFDQIEQQFPYSRWSERAQIMAAYSQYLQNEYTDALLTLDRFLQLHPGNHNVPYAIYLKGLCYFEQMSDAAREQSMTKKAQDSFNDLIARYPDSVYARDARTKMGEMTNHLAAQEMIVGRYYLKLTDLVPAANRFKNVIDGYPDSDQVPEAYYRLTVCYLMMGADKAALKTGQTGIKKYPKNSWSEKIADLIKGK